MSIVEKTISQLPDGESTRTSAAKIPFEQDGTTSNSSFSPNPPTLLYVENQAQLEAELGVDLDIPDNETRTIVYLKSFTQTKPFLMGINSALEIYSATNRVTITYTGPGAYIQNKVSGNSAANLAFPGVLRLTGDGTNKVFDVKITEGVSLEIFIAQNFQDFGTIDSPEMNFDLLGLIGLTTGMVLKNANNITGRAITVFQTGAVGITALSIIGTTATVATIDQLNGTLFAGDSLLFLDPNTTGRSIIINSTVINGDFYQLGVDIAATANAASGSNTQFNITAHGRKVGQYVVLKNFTTFPGYNGTFRVAAVNDVNSVDLEVGFLGVDSTGTMNAASLDSKSVPVLSAGNVGADPSMFTGNSGLEIFGSEVTSSSLALNAFEVITSVSWAFANLERFEIGVVNTGQMKCLDTTSRKYNISFSATLEKTGGGALNIGIVLLKNGTNISFNPPHTVNAGKIQINGEDLVELTLNDTIDIAVINFDATSTSIDISQASLITSRA